MKMLTFKKCLAATLALALQTTGALGAILIDTQPQNVTAIDGTTVSFTVAARSDASRSLTYQWYKLPGTLLSGKTSNRLTITGVKPTDAGSYQVVINELGSPPSSMDSNPATLTVNVRPVISARPLTRSVPDHEGATVPYDVVMNSLGTPPFTYRWQRKVGKIYTTFLEFEATESALPSTNGKATASRLTPHSSRLELADVQLSDVGTYRVQVTNITGTVVNSPDFSQRVNSRPVILTQPAAETVMARGASRTLRVLVGGNGPMTYQWFKGNVPIPRSNSASLTVRGTTETPPGTPDVYRVEIANPISPTAGDPPIQVKTVSANANVHVIRVPVIATHPLAHPVGERSVSIVENPVNQTLTVVMADTVNPGTYQYQWQKDRRNIVDATITAEPSPRTISGALTSTLSLTPVAWLDRGSYRVIVKNEVGTVTSRATTLSIVSKPVIISQSAPSVFGNIGGSVKLFVVAGGTAPLKYEWFYRPVIPGAGFGTVPLSKSASLTLSRLTVARDGEYLCRVSNLSNPTTGTVDSAIISLKVDTAPKITAQTSVVKPAPEGTAPENYFGQAKIAAGGNVRLQVAASGTNTVENPMVYRWQLNRRDIVGAPNLPTIDITAAALTAAGKYRCIISNFSGAVTTSELTISVQNAPQITEQPIDIDQIEETRLESAIVRATGTATLRYLWQKRVTGLGGVFSWQDLTAQKSSRLIIAAPDTDRDSGVYRCRVTNEVGQAISDEIDVIVNPIPVADLGPVVGVSTIPLYPTQAMAGEFVRIFGQNLQYTTSVKFGQISATPVIESANAILVKVPTTAPLTATPIEVISKNGSDFTGSPFTRVTTFANTFREWIDYSLINNNPRIIPFSTRPQSLAGSNKFLEASGYEYGPVWYYFTVPINYRLTVRVTGLSRSGVFLDPSIEIHEEGTSSGNSFFLGPNGITRFRTIPSATSMIVQQIVEIINITSQPATNPAITSRNYMLVVRGTTGDLLSNTSRFGDFNMQLTFTRTSATTIPFAANTAGSLNDSGVDGLTNSGVNAESDGSSENDETRIGGEAGDSADATAVVYEAAAEAAAMAGKTKVSFNVSLEADGASGDDQFAWQVCDAEGDPLLAAWINSADGSVRFVQPDGTSQLSKVSLVHNTDRVAFEINVDTTTATWSVMINGVAASEALPLPQGAQFGKVSTAWDLGPDGVASGASMVFRDFKVEHSLAP